MDFSFFGDVHYLVQWDVGLFHTPFLRLGESFGLVLLPTIVYFRVLLLTISLSPTFAFLLDYGVFSGVGNSIPTQLIILILLIVSEEACILIEICSMVIDLVLLKVAVKVICGIVFVEMLFILVALVLRQEREVVIVNERHIWELQQRMSKVWGCF